MISLDDIVRRIKEEIPLIREKCTDCANASCKGSFHYSSTDAFYVIYPENDIELYFIEFKKMDIFDVTKLNAYTEINLDILIGYLETIGDDATLINEIEQCIGDTINIDRTIRLLKKSKKMSRKSFKNGLKLKPLESYHCIMPWIYKLYCHANDINSDLNEFISFLLNCKKEYIIVYENNRINRSNGRHHDYEMYFSCRNNPFDLQRLSPYPFDGVKIRNPIQFTSFVERISV